MKGNDEDGLEWNRLFSGIDCFSGSGFRVGLCGLLMLISIMGLR